MLAYTTSQSGNRVNLRRILWLRLIVLCGEIAAVTYAVTAQKMELLLTPVAVILFSIAMINAFSTLRLRLPWAVSNQELFLHLAIDVLTLAALLYYTGGSTNPFAPLFLLPLIMTAASLPALYSWAMVVLTVICYTLLLFYFVPLPDMHGAHEHGFRLHVLGMWLGFLFSAVLIAGFVARMANTLRRQDRKIADLREQQLRQERVLALGTLATGAAHELGTPLSTMSILLNDMQANEPLAQSSLDILRQQLARCKSILGSLSSSSGNIRAESGGEQPLDEHLRKLVQAWQQSRPEVQLQSRIEGPDPAPRIIADQTLDQALVNIINNAADASPQEVQFLAQWDDVDLMIEVADRGPGIASDAPVHSGGPVTSTKQNGLGLGLFLTYVTLERLGGKVNLYNREGGGAVCRLQLPLSRIGIAQAHDNA